jgi:hypothetical protein
LIKKILCLSLIGSFILLSASPLFSAEADYVVPSDYRHTYDKLKAILDDLESLLALQEPGVSHPVTFGARLTVADSERAEALLRPQAVTGTLAYLNAFLRLGIRGVTVSINFPLYTTLFPGFQGYRHFYKRVAKETKERGLKLTIVSRFVSVNSDPEKAKRMLQEIIDDLKPDYLCISVESEQEAPDRSSKFVNKCLEGLNRGSTKIATSLGNWSDLEQARNLVSKTAVDCISVRVYPVTGRTIENIFYLAEMARQYRKGLIIDAAWLYKSEKPVNNIRKTWPELQRRNIFSFWAPLDQQFLSCMARLSRLQGVEYFCASGTDYFFAYLKYNSDNAGFHYSRLHALQHKKEVTSLLSDAFSPTGLFYKDLIKEER